MLFPVFHPVAVGFLSLYSTNTSELTQLPGQRTSRDISNCADSEPTGGGGGGGDLEEKQTNSVSAALQIRGEPKALGGVRLYIALSKYK